MTARRSASDRATGRRTHTSRCRCDREALPQTRLERAAVGQAAVRVLPRFHHGATLRAVAPDAGRCQPHRAAPRAATGRSPMTFTSLFFRVGPDVAYHVFTERR